LVLMVGLILILGGCSGQILKVRILETYYLRSNYVDLDVIFDNYIAEIILENSSADKVKFISKHVEDAQGRTYNTNFTYQEMWGQSCCSSDAKYLDAETAELGYFEVLGEMPLDATGLKAFIETENDLLVFFLPDPVEVQVKEVIMYEEGY
jgi:hypothetical protein